MFPVFVKLPLVCGVLLVLFESKSNAQYGGYGKQTGYQNSGPISSYGYTPSFGQSSSFNSYHKSSEYNTITLPDGSTKTEEIVHNSDGTPGGTNTYVNTYGSDRPYRTSSFGTSDYPVSGSLATLLNRFTGRPGFSNSYTDKDCHLPTLKNGMYYYQNSGSYERVPSTPGRYEPSNQRIYIECSPGIVSTPPLSSVCRDGSWFPPLFKCYDTCTRDAHCSQGSVCINNRCVESDNVPCGRPCGPHSECRIHNGQYTCACVYEYLFSKDGCQPSSSFGCFGDNDCPKGKVCDENLCKDPCEGLCGPNSECKKANRGYSCVCLNGFVQDTENGCQPIPKPECTDNSDCDDKHVCRKEKCVDPCPGACGKNTLCRVQNHQAICSCKPGFTRDPTLGCQPHVPCPPLKIRNMNVTCKFQDAEVLCTNPMKPSTTATGECNQFFKPAEELLQLTCLSTGQWDQPQPSCVPDDELCPPLKAPNMNVKCKFQDNEVSCESLMKPGTVATAECNQYYKPTREIQHSQSTCLPTGRWDYPLFKCTPVCGRSTDVGGPTQDLFTPLIIDGKEANIGTFPWHAGLYFRQGDTWEQRCGGSLITDQFVITAAHCVHKDAANDIRIGLGKYYRSWDQLEDSQQKRNVSKIIYPADFHKPTLYFDIALLRLDKNIEVGKYVMPACTGILGGSESLLNEKLYVVGWGQTRDVRSGSSSETLLYNDVMFLPRNNCQRLIPQIISLFDKFCAVKNNNSVSEVSIAQPGDSGGGMTVMHNGLHYIFGVVSGKMAHVTTFTNVTWLTHLMWIENEMRQYDSNYRWNES